MTWRVGFIAFVALAANAVVGAKTPTTVNWDAGTLRFATEGAYGRLARLHDNATLLSYESRGVCYARRSDDDGRTWSAAVRVADCASGSAANPQPLVLADGTVWLLYDERPRDKTQPFAIRLATSADNGRTWTPRAAPLYTAGVEWENGCWEPAAVQLASGRIQLFFANEGPYRRSDEQDITLMMSDDAGRTWDAPTRVSFRPGHRDGMPVPAVLADGRVAVAIEDNGVTADGQMKPVIVAQDADGWQRLPVRPGDPRRRPAVETGRRANVTAGAPYLCRLESGATVLSCQSNDGGPLRMAVYVGDASAGHFVGPTWPFPIDTGREGLWNSLFAKNADTVTAVSGTTIDGRRGIWLIDGKAE